MKAYVSFSANDNNLHLVSLLSFKLQDNKFKTLGSNDFLKDELSFTTKSNIQNAHLFVGIITDTGSERTRVIEEWNFAKSSNTPDILLIEDTVPNMQKIKGNIIRFNRFNPEAAIRQIEEKTEIKATTKNNISEALPWLLGGVAILAFLFFLLSKSNKEATA
ncbi:MAG: hypothetical protein RLZZ292_94 [Bacteroidota bacterium]|jgi:hypothetical protein